MVAVGAAADPGEPATVTVLHQREHRQVRSLHRWQGTLRFFHRHPRLERTEVGRREVRRAKVWLPIIRRELGETRAQLRPRNPWSAEWFRQALCIHSREGAWNDNTGNGYFGGAQFLRSTWESVGGPYDPAFDHPGDRRFPFSVSPREQLYRMWLVWKRDGQSWSEWGTAGACRLT